MRRTCFAIFAALSLLTGCATVTPINYTPNPARIANPAEEARAIIMANTVGGCIAEPELATPTMLVVKFACTSGNAGVGNVVARLDQVQSISLQESGGWYRVLVKHTSDINDFAWTSRSLPDMERLADALAGLSAGPTAASPTPVAGAADI